MAQTQKGRLKIFFSYAEGAGKRTAMRKAGLQERKRGRDVLVLDGQKEMELEQVLERRPDLILVDTLARENETGSRHRRRYQDIEELLKSGIDVYTTANVENIEGLYDTVSAITGRDDWERIPDEIFDRADRVELIDIEPLELLERLKKSGKEFSVFTVEQLTALRETALRRCADRMKHLFLRQQENNAFQVGEHILVCLSSAPSNAKIIRTAARMAAAFNSQFTALFVETPDFGAATPENRQRLIENRALAEQLGAQTETVYGEDIPYQIAEFARLSGVTKIVLGRSIVTRKHLFGKMTLTEELISYAPEMDIHIIPDGNSDRAYRPVRAKNREKSRIFKNIAASACILLGATLLSQCFYQLGFTEANIIMVYILGVLLTSAVVTHQVYSLVSSIASVFIFNFLFTHPRFSLTAYATGYPVTFVVMFLTAYITGTFAIRYKKQAGQSAKIAHRTKILFDTDQLLSKAGNKEEILNAAAEQVVKLLGRNIVVFDSEGGKLSAPAFFSPEGGCDTFCSEEEWKTAEWVLKNNHAAGATTDTLSKARYMYLALRVNERVYGVMGIEAENNPLDASEHGILLSILGECALALENEKNAREKEAAAVLAESEQLRANLLRTISHDLRTPLTTISGNASNLLSNGDYFDEETKKQIYADIYDDSMWLIDLVENLLYATRIEEGRMTLNTSMELLSDIVDEALKYIGRKAGKHRISVGCEDDLLLVRADGKLIVQVIVNIVDNAIKYTAPGSEILITIKRNVDMAEIAIGDNGEGIPDREKEKVFEKFYCGTNKIADNRRSLGLGLYLCRAIVEAHGGAICVADNQPKGTVFRFSLPLEEVTLHE